MVAKFETSASLAMWSLNLVQVMESISGSVVPLAMFLHDVSPIRGHLAQRCFYRYDYIGFQNSFSDRKSFIVPFQSKVSTVSVWLEEDLVETTSSAAYPLHFSNSSYP